MKIVSLLLLCFIFSLATPQKASAQNTAVDFQVFYDELSPYGTWINNPNYGYVWIPNVGAGFAPYVTDGNWVLTDDGWTWVSDYSWGWAPFHYGRWFTDPFYGPTWIPDYQWGPGWVTWRRSDDYFGWAVMGPGISFSMSFGNDYNVPNNDWRFVRSRDFGRSDMHNYYMNPSNNISIISNTTIINNRRTDNVRHSSYNAGPERQDVEKHAGRTFTPIHINETKTPGQNFSNGQLHMYRPQMQNNPNKARPAPARVSSLADVKTRDQRTTQSPQHINQSTIQQPQHNSQPITQPIQQSAQHNNKPTTQQHQSEPVKQQPAQQQHNNPQTQQHQPAQPQHSNPAPQQHQPTQAPPKQQQPTQPQHSNPPPQQHQPTQAPPRQQQPVQPQHSNPAPQQHQPVQPQHSNPPPQQQSAPNREEKKPPHDN